MSATGEALRHGAGVREEAAEFVPAELVDALRIATDDDRLLVVAICTRDRPKMLTRCLNSLVSQTPPPGWRWRMVVVENDAEAKAAPIIEALRARSAVEIDYRRQPKMGIPFARNTAIEAALALGADWLAFVDDDEAVAPDWLREMAGAITGYGADVVEGPVYFDASEGSSAWIGQVKYLFEEGIRRDRASTANVALSVRLVAPPPEGLGLRFDERLRFTGGSDTEFFTRATAAGATIIWTRRPRVIEHLPRSRLTFAWQFRRWYRISANESQRLCGVHGWRAAARQLIRPSLKLVKGGAVTLAIAPLKLFLGRDKFRSKALRGGQRLAWGLGALIGLTPLRPRPYTRIDGE